MRPQLTVYIFLINFIGLSTANAEVRQDSLGVMARTVKSRAEDLIKKGFTAGDGYGEVWIRDFNTFMDVSCKVNDKAQIKKHLLTFFKFQQEDGGILDGYVPASNNSVGYNYYHSKLAPEYAGHKNTVETDQESSLIQAVAKYIRNTGDKSILKETIAGRTVQQRMEEAMKFLLKQRYEPKYGLIWGATTADWGDVQPEHSWGVVLDSNSHRAIDIYDNAMFVIAINDYLSTADPDAKRKNYWNGVNSRLKKNIIKYLWDRQRNQFKPHIYLNGSPFPASFNESAVYYHGGTTTAIGAGLLSKAQVLEAYQRMQENVKLANAATIGLTLYPVYPQGSFKNTGMGPYSYQNGGDWTWFGGRTITALIKYGYLKEAKEALKPMLARVIKNNGFYEWYTPANVPQGSSSFKGEAGVLWTAITALEKAERDLSKPDVQTKLIWEIGKADNKADGMALAPSGYAKFLDQDFGWEDRFFLVGFSKPEKDFPYVLPGPDDAWGGTGPTSGLRSHNVNILFGLADAPASGSYKLVIDLVGYQSITPPLFKVSINGKSFVKQLLVHADDNSVTGDLSAAKELIWELPLEPGLLKKGGNEVHMTTLDGSWLVFDQVKLVGSEPVKLTHPANLFLREVKAADYEIADSGKRFQPLLVDVQHLAGKPMLTVKLDGMPVFKERLDSARYQFEVPMAAVKSNQISTYEIFSDGVLLERGKVNRTPQQLYTPADYVDTKMGTAHSRWMIAPGPWMPFGMVKLSPDNQNPGWQAGYDPTFESVGAFSHIHEWTMAGLGMLPVNGPLKIKGGDERIKGDGYRSKIDKSTEEAPLGYYKVMLKDYDVNAELTATTRCGFQRYTYPKATDSRVMIDLQIPAEYSYSLKNVSLKKVSDYRIEGFSRQFTPGAWSGDVNQDYILHFVIEFDQPIKKFGTWKNDKISDQDLIETGPLKDAGAYVEFDTRSNPVVQVRTGISLVSLENASQNLLEEVTKPYGWSFDQVREGQRSTWNKLIGRVGITTTDRREKIRFYTNMYRALASRNTWSDLDGSWVDAKQKVQKMKDANSPALGCDAFWNTFWNLNQFWNLVTPEWSSKWVKSQLAMYDANGWLAKGPAGMNYVPVMVAEHEIPLIVGAYQMGIRDYDAQKAFEAVNKMQTTPAQKVGLGFAGNRDLEAYLKYKYVPYDKGRFSNTLEYAYDDWTVSQFAKSLGKKDKEKEFALRAAYWKNVIDEKSGYAVLKKSDGTWFPDFDPFKSGANEHYVEGNAWQLTYFVPQDVPGLAKKIGVDRFIDRLTWGFGESDKMRYNAPGDQYWDYPVIQGNQQSMHFAFLFNWVKKPWLTQRWSRAIIDRYYGYGLANAYLGDEDQGQMSAWFVMVAMGLFQTDGGCSADPVYEIGSPIFPKVTIDLGEQYGRGKTFVIEAPNVSRSNKYVQSATLNGKTLNSFKFPADELLKGGKLVLQMGPNPNTAWGIE